MTTDNPSPKARFGNTNKLGKFKKDKLVPYSVKIDPQTVILIKQIQSEHGLKSQSEVVTKAIKLLLDIITIPC
jgi:hypothetical protein